MARLLDYYKNQIIPAMMKKFGYKNKMQVPHIRKVVINMGVGSAISDIKILEAAAHDLALITGQKPLITRAKKAIANFKIRKGLPIGCKVTLRGKKMYEFIDRLVNVALPRIRDFRGVSPTAFDKRGNYAFGISEQTIFPEIKVDEISKIQGMDIIFEIKSKSSEESRELLRLMGMPFRQA